MKRQQDRDSPPRTKRSRSGYPGPEHEISRDRLTPDFDRRERIKMGPREPKQFREYDMVDMESPRKYESKYREDRMSDSFPPRSSDRSSGGGGGGPPGPGGTTPDYRSLCISNISSKISDPHLKDTLIREFKKYGEFNVKIAFSGDQRVAYINFRYPEDARTARHSRSKLILFDRPVRVDPVFNKRRSPTRETYSMPHERPVYPSRNQSPPRRGPNRYTEPVYRESPVPFPPPSRGGRDYHGPPPRSPPRSSQPPPPMNMNDIRRGPNEKFPYHLDHINPEDDDKATRTLFVGNLDYYINDGELKRTFEKYGPVYDIDIKRPQKGQGNAYAFIKFVNLDCAHKAKVALSGTYIGRFQCKIGYGKVQPSTCLWVGGLGPWVSYQTLEREFDRFGVIHKIEWPEGKNFAYVLYDNIDAAQAACQEMRGFPLGGLDHRLRVDFTELSQLAALQERENASCAENATKRNFDSPEDPYRGGSFPDDRSRNRREDWRIADPMNNYRNPDNPRDSGRKGEFDRTSDQGERRKKPRTPEGYSDRAFKQSRSPERPEYVRDRDSGFAERRVGNSTEIDGTDGRVEPRKVESNGKDVESVTTLAEVAKSMPVAWNGALILKCSAFPARMHVVSGDVTLVDNLMRDPTTTETPVLRFTQRLRLEQPKLDDVTRRVSTAGSSGYCILLALPGTLQNFEESSAVQQRPLHNLVVYLKQKEAAGVISLPPNPSKDKDNVGVLYAFPPSQFGHEYLQKKAEHLGQEPSKEDHLTVIVVRGAA